MNNQCNFCNGMMIAPGETWSGKVCCCVSTPEPKKIEDIESLLSQAYTQGKEDGIKEAMKHGTDIK